MEAGAKFFTNLESANLKGAELDGSLMGGVSLRVATLKNANMQNCYLRQADLAGADLEVRNAESLARKCSVEVENKHMSCNDIHVFNLTSHIRKNTT